jgi:ParB family chromosome partitioning protein
VAAFVQTWTSLAGWWTHYDPDELAAELTDDQARVFLTVAAGTVAFADRPAPAAHHRPRRGRRGRR